MGLDRLEHGPRGARGVAKECGNLSVGKESETQVPGRAKYCLRRFKAQKLQRTKNLSSSLSLTGNCFQFLKGELALDLQEDLEDRRLRTTPR